ncbi:MAG: hypothetical protein GF416_09445 [Candidatus Altiarchaeales archaeon]|nr:hypothetical protein [Candidatus Altiarchaeales archaeon]MBD3417343.1 hypothetical protein [Candidatus Altiarchaeales archaeon]
MKHRHASPEGQANVEARPVSLQHEGLPSPAASSLGTEEKRSEIYRIVRDLAGRNHSELEGYLDRRMGGTIAPGSTLRRVDRIYGVCRAFDEKRSYWRPSKAMKTLLGLYSYNVEFGTGKGVYAVPLSDGKRPTLTPAQEELAFYTLTRGFTDQPRPDRFLRSFAKIPESNDMCRVMLTTLERAYISGVEIPVDNAAKALDLLVNRPSVRNAYSGEGDLMDGETYLTARGLAIASCLRKPDRMQEFADSIAPGECLTPLQRALRRIGLSMPGSSWFHKWAEKMSEHGELDAWNHVLNLRKDDPDCVVRMRVHQATRVVDVIPGEGPMPGDWSEYITARLRGHSDKGHISIYGKDLWWCNAVEACRGAVRALRANGFPDEMPVRIRFDPNDPLISTMPEPEHLDDEGLLSSPKYPLRDLDERQGFGRAMILEMVKYGRPLSHQPRKK